MALNPFLSAGKTIFAFATSMTTLNFFAYSCWAVAFRRRAFTNDYREGFPSKVDLGSSCVT